MDNTITDSCMHDKAYVYLRVYDNWYVWIWTNIIKTRGHFHKSIKVPIPFSWEEGYW